MTFENSFWNSNSVDDLYHAENPEQALIQPQIAAIVNGLAPKRMLDFGCGDAWVEKLINKNIKVSLFDKNSKTLSEAFDSLNRGGTEVITHEDEIPSAWYDCILLSFVLVCVETEKEQDDIFRRLKEAKTKNGILLVTNSHPCFLPYKFTAFETSIDADEFQYLNQGMPYTVSIKQPLDKPSISFQDYHWSLSFWINLAVKHGFELIEMIEVPDQDYKNIKRNKLYPPFLILKFK